MDAKTLEILKSTPPPRAVPTETNPMLSLKIINRMEANIGGPDRAKALYEKNRLDFAVNRPGNLATMKKQHAILQTEWERQQASNHAPVASSPAPTLPAAANLRIHGAPVAHQNATAGASQSKPRFGRQAGEPADEVLAALRSKLFGPYPDTRATEATFAGADPGVFTLNFETNRDAFFKAHIPINGLSFEQCKARKVHRENYPNTNDGIKQIEVGKAFAEAFIATANGQDTTGAEFASNFHRAGMQAGERFNIRRERAGRAKQAQLAAAKANLNRAQQNYTEAEKATLKHFGVL